MNCNVGSMDRIVRVVFGLALIIGGIYVTGKAGIILSVVGLIPLFTGLAGRCPAYSIFKISTCKI